MRNKTSRQAYEDSFREAGTTFRRLHIACADTLVAFANAVPVGDLILLYNRGRNLLQEAEERWVEKRKKQRF